MRAVLPFKDREQMTTRNERAIKEPFEEMVCTLSFRGDKLLHITISPSERVFFRDECEGERMGYTTSS